MYKCTHYVCLCKLLRNNNYIYKLLIIIFHIIIIIIVYIIFYSLWLRSMTGMSGILVSQATGSSPLYRLSLIADSNNFIVRFSYISSVEGVTSVETSVSQASLTEGAWHSLTLTATNQTASFYADGVLLTSR